MRKPVVEITTDKMWDYEFQAKIHISRSYKDETIILASDSLINLKREVRERGYSLAWITCTNGMMSYGQNLVNEYPYKPR